MDAGHPRLRGVLTSTPRVAGRQTVGLRTERFHAPDPTSTGYDGIFVINADGTGEHAVNSPGGGLIPEWAPDGRIVFSSPRPDGTEGLFAVRPDGTHLQNLQIYAEHVGWNPSGTEVLLDRNKIGGAQNWDIWRVDAHFDNLVQLTDAPGDDSARINNAGVITESKTVKASEPFGITVALNGDPWYTMMSADKVATLQLR
jgi:hypothetical protein